MKSKRIFSLLFLLSLVCVVNAQYDSPAYVRGIQNRANRTFNNGVANIQQMMRNQLQNSQNTQNRLSQAFTGVNNWAAEYERQNGSTPYEVDKDSWVLQNYPDVYNLYIQGKYGSPNSQGPQKCWTCNGTGQCECARKGHPGQKATMLTTNNGQQVLIKHQYCNGTGICPECKNGYK